MRNSLKSFDYKDNFCAPSRFNVSESVCGRNHDFEQAIIKKWTELYFCHKTITNLEHGKFLNHFLVATCCQIISKIGFTAIQNYLIYLEQSLSRQKQNLRYKAPGNPQANFGFLKCNYSNRKCKLTVTWCSVKSEQRNFDNPSPHEENAKIHHWKKIKKTSNKTDLSPKAYGTQ